MASRSTVFVTATTVTSSGCRPEDLEAAATMAENFLDASSQRGCRSAGVPGCRGIYSPVTLTPDDLVAVSGVNNHPITLRG